MSSPLSGVQALLFDVFGTVVDWHGSVTKELERVGKQHGTPPMVSHVGLSWR
ncbi:hypothetical protein R3P38DRAFT_2936938 [Favolaschia claudopus]|uniref:Haloacid dehalogenase type II n=1 Tax=Favolaschia claudopus TaxID=2862362 RepID=A0AAW0BQT6_9AGAR